jgi:8-oxo-dGTP pyrophosphatase MutT (NUDIX family)
MIDKGKNMSAPGHNLPVPAPDDDLAVLETRLRAGLSAPLPGPEAQLRFAPRPTPRDWDPAAQPAGARHAAALILLYPGDAGPAIALTRRHADLPHHGGQISLPGGGIHAGETPADAATREAHEEIGVDPASVRVLGGLSPLWVAVSGFVVHPVVAVTGTRPAWVPCPREVDEILEAPVARLRDRTVLDWARRRRAGVDVLVPHFRVADWRVWGATAMILGEFAAVLDPAFGPGPAPDAGDERLITLL